MKTSKNRFKIRLHPMFVVLGLVLLIIGEIEVFLITTLSAMVHEYGHYLVASKLNYKMSYIRLMPFGAELFGDFDSFDDRDELYIAIAGPIVNFIIVIIILSLWWLKPSLYNITETVLTTNLVMGIFNLIPIFPLDGGRVVLCLLTRRLNRKRAAKLVKATTKVFAAILFCLFIITIFTKINLTFGIVAFMLFFTASSNFKEATYQKIELSKLVKEKSVEWIFVSIPETTKYYELKKKHIKNKVIQFLVLDSSNRISYSFNELELEKVALGINAGDDLKKLKKILFNNNNNYLFIIDKIKNM